MKSCYLKHLAPWAMSLACFSAPMLAEERELDTIIVTATRSEQPAVVTPVNIATITRDEIEASGTNNIVDLLRTQAGIQLSDFIGNGSRATVSMRGFGANAANNTLIMIDGRKLNNPSIEAPVLTAIATKDIERIEIIQGSGGVLYGDQAVGGVINIITRRPENTPYYHIETSMGSDDLKTYRGSASQQFENGFAYRVSAEDKTTDNYRDNNNANYDNYLARAEQNGNWGQVFVETQYINDELRLPGSLTSAQARADRKQTLTPNDYSNIVTDMYRVGGTAKLSNHWSLLAEATDRDSDLDGLITFFTSDTFQQDTHVRTLTPRLVGAVPTQHGTTHITIGYDQQESDYQYSSTNIFAAPKDATQDIDAIYAQIVYPFIENWTATAGLRESAAHDKNKLNAAKSDEHETTTEAGLNWRAMDHLRLFLRRAESVRFANADENAFTLPGVTFLDAQTGVSHEAGLEFTDNRYRAKATWFDMDIDDEIYFDAFVFANINLPQSNRKGIMLDGEYDLTRDLTMAANYTYTDTEISEGNFQGNEVPFVSKNMATASLRWQAMQHLSLYAESVYTGSRYMADDDANAGSRAAGYWIHNLALVWDKQHLNASLRLNNITGKEYATLESIYDYQYTAPEESIELTLGYTF